MLVESNRVFRRRRFHRQKLRQLSSGTRRLSAELGDRDRDRARYLRGALERIGRPVLVHEPTSFAAAELVER